MFNGLVPRERDHIVLIPQEIVFQILRLTSDIQSWLGSWRCGWLFCGGLWGLVSFGLVICSVIDETRCSIWIRPALDIIVDHLNTSKLQRQIWRDIIYAMFDPFELIVFLRVFCQPKELISKWFLPETNARTAWCLTVVAVTCLRIN
jgi:hypothetical protein